MATKRELKSRLLFGCVAIATLTTLTGCSHAPHVATQGDLRAVIAPDNTSGMDALITGEVTVSPNGCWALLVEGTDSPIPVLWPKGTELIDNAMRFPGTSTIVNVGALVALGGGYVQGGGYTAGTDCWDARVTP